MQSRLCSGGSSQSRNGELACRNARRDSRTILLLDSVLTTCGAAARALKQASAKRVVVAVMARTGKSSV